MYAHMSCLRNICGYTYASTYLPNCVCAHKYVCMLELCDTIDIPQYCYTKWVSNYSNLWYCRYRLCHIFSKFGSNLLCRISISVHRHMLKMKKAKLLMYISLVMSCKSYHVKYVSILKVYRYQNYGIMIHNLRWYRTALLYEQM